jgi:multicomponent Na+:H+ antiporter subunit C
MSVFAYGVGVWLVVVGIFGVLRSRDLIHTVVCVSIAQAGTFVFLLAVGYQTGLLAPMFGSGTPQGAPAVAPMVLAMTLVDIAVATTVTTLLFALMVRILRRPGRPRALRG